MANDDINNLGGEVSKLTGMMQSFEQVAAGLIGTFTNISSKGVAAFKNIGETAASTFSSLSAGSQAAGEAVDGVSDAGEKLVDVLLGVNSVFANHDIFNKFAENAKTQFLSISDASKALGNNMGLIGKALDAMAGKNISSGLDKLVNMSAAGQQAEAGFYAMVSSSAQLNDVWGEGAGKIGNLQVNTSNYIGTLQNLAVENKTTIDATLALAKAMSEVPSTRDAMVNITGTDANRTSSSIDAITAVMKVATGSGHDYRDVISAITNAYANLGNAQDGTVETTQRGINLFSTMVELQQRLGIRFEDSKKALEGVANQFRNVGDETDSAAKIFDTFGRALQNTGISAKASMDIVGTMIEGIGKLNTGTKAFLSSQAGGPGGLQGGLQIDEMLRKHDLAGVMNIAQNALKKQMGGRIYTQEEGAQSQEAASAYTRQKMLLQSGAFGIGAGTDDQTAGRILEALKQGDISGLKDTMKTGQERAGDLVEKGNAIQERNATEITRMAQIMQRNTIAAEITAAATMRKTLGSEASPEALANMQKYYDQATASLRENEHKVGNMGAEAHSSVDTDISLKNLRGNNFEDAKAVAVGLTEGAKKAMSMMNPNMNTASEAHKQEIMKHAAMTSPTTAMARQALATKEAVSKTPEKEQTVKVMIELNDPGKNVKSVKTTPAYQAQHKKDLTPTSSTPSSDPGY